MRIIGEVTPERAEILRAADAIVVEEIRRAGLYRELWQSFAVLPAVRTVGVMGDGRTYAYPIVIRAVTSDDAMTADWARLPYDLLERISSRIINEVEGVNRVALDITSKPPGHHRVGVSATPERRAPQLFDPVATSSVTTTETPTVTTRPTAPRRRPPTIPRPPTPRRATAGASASARPSCWTG